jgi:hypothetical protein
MLLVLLAALLQPALARLAVGGGAWAEICTAQGARLVAVAEDGDGRDSLHGAWDHCPWCLRLEAAPPPAQVGRPEPWAAHPGRLVAAAPQDSAAPAPRPLPPPRGPPRPALG